MAVDCAVVVVCEIGWVSILAGCSQVLATVLAHVDHPVVAVVHSAFPHLVANLRVYHDGVPRGFVLYLVA